MIENTFYSFLEFIDSEKSMQLHRKTLEGKAKKEYESRLDEIATAYRDADTVRVGLLAPEGSPTRKIAEAYVAEAQPDIEAEQKRRDEAAKRIKTVNHSL